MPDARLRKMRDAYPEQPQWRRPSENAAEWLHQRQHYVEPAAAAIGADAVNDFVRFINDVDVRAKVDAQYREGASARETTPAIDWYMTANVIEGEQH